MSISLFFWSILIFLCLHSIFNVCLSSVSDHFLELCYFSVSYSVIHCMQHRNLILLIMKLVFCFYHAGLLVWKDVACQWDVFCYHSGSYFCRASMFPNSVFYCCVYFCEWFNLFQIESLNHISHSFCINASLLKVINNSYEWNGMNSLNVLL